MSPRRYELGEQIGAGGFGTVHRGRLFGEGGFSKEVAIKLLHADTQSHPEIASRLRDEARLLGLLNARSIVRVEDLIQIDGRWAVVMELVPGEDLGTLLKRGPVPPRVVAEIGVEVARALEAAWNGAGDTGPLRAVHRDVKPANIRITPTGEVRVLDFGVARACFSEREAQTRSLSFGSPGYIAPERYEGVDSHAADVFALGVVLLESLTAKKLGQLPPHPDRLAAMRDAALQRVSDVVLRGLIGRMLAYEAAERPTAAEVARRLREHAPRLAAPWLADWAPVVVAGAPAPVDLLVDSLSTLASPTGMPRGAGDSSRGRVAGRRSASPPGPGS